MQYEHENQIAAGAGEGAGRSGCSSRCRPIAPVTVVDRGGPAARAGHGSRRGRTARRAAGAERGGAADGRRARATPLAGWKTSRITAARSMCSPIWRPKPGRKRRSRSLPSSLDDAARGERVSDRRRRAEAAEPGLGALRLSSEQLAPGGLLQLTTELVRSAGRRKQAKRRRSSSCTSATATAKPEKRGQQVVADVKPRAAGRTSRVFAFRLGAGHAPGIRADRRRRRPALRRCALLHGRRAAAEQGAAAGRKRRRDAVPARGARADGGGAAWRSPKFDCDVKTFGELESSPLADYAAVCLVDPPPLSRCRRGKRWRILPTAGGGVGSSWAATHGATR